MMKKIMIGGTIAASIILSGCSQEENEKEFLTDFSGEVDHVHGVGYVEGSIAIAAHDGLKYYNDEQWSATTKQNNDYMGFNAVNKGFYTSGHPGKGSNLPNPLGIQKSNDKGENLEEIAFEGDFDFHLMGVGYQNHAIYVVNGHGNSKLKAGFHRSLDNGETWNRLKAEGLKGEVKSIAVHPTKEEIVAAATKNGIYLSKNGGKSFNPVVEETNGTAVHFSNDKLYYGAFKSKPVLVSFDYTSHSKQEMKLPSLDQDAVAYMAHNPEDDGNMVIYTFKNQGYVTKNMGEDWNHIIQSGQVN